jgi:hypothetical protein
MKKKNCLEQLIDFFKSNQRNKWLEDKDMKVYVRKSKRLLPKEKNLIETLDIATIEAIKPGKGHGTKFIKAAHEINPFQMTFIENVLTPRFVRWFEKDGWTMFPSENMVPCFIKLKS